MVVTGWGVTVKNKSFFPSKVIDQTTWNNWTTVADYQMAEHLSSPSFFRTYWAIDPDYSNGLKNNYDQNGFYNNFNYLKWSEANNTAYSSSTSTGLVNDYCLENTFNYTNQ